VDVDEGPWSDRIDDETEFGGAVPAVSLHAAVLDKNGRVVHERQAGLVLLSRIRLTGSPDLDAPRFEAEAVEDPFADRDALVRGIARALDPWLSPLGPADVGE
jgi:hypothetical protein